MFRNNILFVVFLISLTLLLNTAFAAEKAKKTYEKASVLKGHSKDVQAVAFSPDGTILATGSSDKTVMLWTTDTWKTIKTLEGHEEEVKALAFSPDGKMLASGDKDKRILLWDVVSGKQTGKIKAYDSVNALSFSPDGKLLAIAADDNVIALWDIAKNEVSKKLKGHKDNVNSIAFSPDGKTLASGSKDSMVVIWDAATGEALVNTRGGHINDVLCLAFSPDGKVVATGGADYLIFIWDSKTGESIHRLMRHSEGVRSVVFSPDSKVMVSVEGKSSVVREQWRIPVAATSSADTCNMVVWDPQTWKIIGSIRGACDVNSLAVSSGGKRIAAAGNAVTIYERK
ncbi:MAG: hypothetical protein A2X59_06590 [Nitrospirae bacterium GWC2_42_7]|nr:MAG: hypothetical protein A2X59_06590 [Nitrospirae bacterium GWC2_42_7]